MSGPSPLDLLGLLRSQLIYHPAAVHSSFSEQVVIVTGGNSGLGKDVIRQLVSLDAHKVIMAVRNEAKGQAAVQEIELQTSIKGRIDVWPLDMASTSSVMSFGERVKKLPRLDAVVLNAGIWPTGKIMVQDYEATLAVNVIFTSILARLILPKMRETALEYRTTTRLTFVGSNMHKSATLVARRETNAADVLVKMSAQNLSNGGDFLARYSDSKLLLQMYAQRLAAEHMTAHGQGVCITVVNPGYCVSNLKPATDFGSKLMEKALARSTEEGGRTIVDAIALDKVDGRHGKYIDDCQIKPASAWLDTEDGRKTSALVCQELESIAGRALGESTL